MSFILYKKHSITETEVFPQETIAISNGIAGIIFINLILFQILIMVGSFFSLNNTAIPTLTSVL